MSKAAGISTRRSSGKRVALIASVLGVGVIFLAGCASVDSQIAALKGISGLPEDTLQIAVGRQLVDKKVPVQVTPECQPDADEANGFVCMGETKNGERILVTATKNTDATFTLAPGGNPTKVPAGTFDYTMIIKVGDKQIYDGGVQAAISANQDGAQ